MLNRWPQQSQTCKVPEHSGPGMPFVLWFSDGDICLTCCPMSTLVLNTLRAAARSGFPRGRSGLMLGRREKSGIKGGQRRDEPYEEV